MSEPSDARPRGWGWHIWVAIATAISGFCLAWLSSQLPTEELLKRAFTRSLVPVLTPLYHHPDGNPITIVTIGDDDLDPVDRQWPIPLDFLGRRLKKILELDPQAVFIDLMFAQNRSKSELDAFTKVLCNAKRPVFIAIDSMSTPRSHVESELLKARRAGTTTPCALPANPRITPDELDQLQWAYPMHLGEQQKKSPSPTLWIYCKWMDQPDAQCPEVPAKKPEVLPPNRSAALTIYCHLYAQTCPDHGTAKPELEPLALVWPARAAKTNNEIMIVPVPASPKNSQTTDGDKGAKGQETAPPRYEAICRDHVPLKESIPLARPVMNLVDPLGKRIRDLLPCPYHQVVPLRAFNTMQIADSVNAEDNEVDQAARKAATNGQSVKIGFAPGELGNAIGHKIVMIGGDVSAAGDIIVSPVHGRLPGVHVHAMALDNLIAFEGAYKEYGDFDLTRPSGTGSLFVAFSIVLIVGVLAAWHRYFPEPPRSVDTPMRKLEPRGLFGSQITMIICSPFQLVLNKPKFRGGDAAMRRLRITHHVTFAVVNTVLVTILFGVGYWFFRQGPLSMVEYVLFPFFAHFLHLGELVAQRGLRWWNAFHSPDPWRHWSAVAPEADGVKQ